VFWVSTVVEDDCWTPKILLLAFYPKMLREDDIFDWICASIGFSVMFWTKPVFIFGWENKLGVSSIFAGGRWTANIFLIPFSAKMLKEDDFYVEFCVGIWKGSSATFWTTLVGLQNKLGMSTVFEGGRWTANIFLTPFSAKMLKEDDFSDNFYD